MKILKVEPGKRPQIVEIDKSLKAMQEIVGGYIQAIHPFNDYEITLVCCDDGKVLNMPLNRALRFQDTNEIYDIVQGTFFLCRSSIELETFVELTPEQMAFCQEYFRSSEVFVDMGGAIMVVKLDN